MKTQQEIISWLKSTSQVRVILLEIAGVLVNGTPTNFYLSNRPFVTSPSDIPPNTHYQNVISGGIQFSESLDLNGGQPTIGFGDISIDNTEGLRDDWLEYVWVNKSVSIYIGDLTWPRVDFYMIFKGLIRDIDSSGLNSINLLLVNGLQNINTPISDVILEGNPSSPNQLIPLTFGECFNVTPLLVDPNNLTYQVHTGKIQDIIEVRDNGTPVSISKNLNNGKFNLTYSPYGTITASVQGNQYSGTTYSSKISDVVRDILFPIIGSLPELIFTVTTTSANNVVSIEFQGTRSPTLVIDWGDGSAVTSTVNGVFSKTYTVAGDYVLKIKGIKFGFKVVTGANYITDISQWGTAKFTNLNSAFKNVVFSGWSTSDIPDLSECTDIGNMFEGAANFNEESIVNWTVTSVTNMSGTFKNASSFNRNIATWDISNVTNTSEMFYGATVFDQDITAWDVTSVTNMAGMFQNASAFNQDLSVWDVFHITTKPTNFDTNAVSWTSFLDPLNRPLWGRPRSQPQLDFTNTKLLGIVEGSVNNVVPIPAKMISEPVNFSGSSLPAQKIVPGFITVSSNFNVPFEIRGGEYWTTTLIRPVNWPPGGYTWAGVFSQSRAPQELILRVNGLFRTTGYGTIWSNSGTSFTMILPDFLNISAGSSNTIELFTYV